MSDWNHKENIDKVGYCAWCQMSWPCGAEQMRRERDEAEAHAKALAEALRHAVNEYPDEFYVEDLRRFRHVLAAYDKDHEPQRPPWDQPPTTCPTDREERLR